MITTAKVEDIPQIISFCYKTYGVLEEVDLPKPSFDKITKTVTNWVLYDTVLVYKEQEDSKTLGGVLIAEKGSLWWTDDDSFLQTALFYVDKDNVSKPGKVAFELVDKFKEYADDFNLTVILDIIDKKDNLEVIKRFINSKGFTPFSISGTYRKT